MRLITKFMTQNDCYKQGRKIKPQGIMVHSTATPGVMAERWFELWNKPGITKCVHAFVDDTGVYQYLPWDMRGWHAGGSANNTHIGFEICEPKNLDDKAYFQKIWQIATELVAFLCEKFSIPVSEVIGHYEGYKKGIASNHGDPAHWFSKHGKTMDDFRADVCKLLEQKKAETNKLSAPQTGITYYVQVGAYKALENAQNQVQALKAKGFDAIIKENAGIYRVQVGAYSYKENADKMAQKVKSAGFDAIVTTQGGKVVTTTSSTAKATATLKVGSKVKVKNGAKTYDGKSLANFVYKETYDVIQVNGDRVVIGKGKAVTAAVKKQDLIIL